MKNGNGTRIDADETDLPREILQSRNPHASGLFHRMNTDAENKKN